MKDHIGVAHGGVIASGRCLLHLGDRAEQVITGGDVVGPHEKLAGSRLDGGAQHLHVSLGHTLHGSFSSGCLTRGFLARVSTDSTA